MLPAIFEPTVDDLARLSPDQAVAVLSAILHGEAALLGISPTFVSVPSEINVSDGGIDAEVAGAMPSSTREVLFAGQASYQVKAGTFSFSGTDIRSILLKPSARSKPSPQVDDLQPRVKACFDQNGVFVLVLFSSDVPEKTEGQHVNAIRAELHRIAPQYQAPQIRVWQPNQLTKLTALAPGTALTVKGVRAPHGIHGVQWLGQSSGFEGSFVSGAAQDDALKKLRSAMAASSGFAHVRLVGEPGIGKSRLLYEALKDDRIASLAVYSPDGDELVKSGLLDQIQILASSAPVVLAVDECDPETRTLVHKRLRNAGPKVALVTIYSELDEQDTRSPEYQFLEPPKLTNEQIAEVIKAYGVPGDKAQIVSELCDGSPRVAHSVGLSLSTAADVQELLSPRDLDNIWEHFIAGASGRRSPDFPARHTVLCCLALFKRFGWSGPVNDEARQIHRLLIEPIDSSITWTRFVDIIDQLRQRRILQGQTTLYITPRLLHIKLWCDWWERHSSAYDVPAVFSGFGEKLREWLAEMFAYARESPAAFRVVENLLATNGSFRSLSGYGGTIEGLLFFKLAQAHPKAALRTLKQALGGSTLDERRNFTDGRRYVVHALEHIALYGDCFADAANCLLLLAEAENETWGNNSSGVFAELFGLGPGKMAPTELSPQERLPVLLSALRSLEQSRVTLALNAFDHALRTQIVRMDIGSAHGLRAVPRGWMPSTYGELWESYRVYVDTLWTERKKLASAEAARAADILLSHARSLVQAPPIAELIVKAFEDLSRESEDDSLKVLETVVEILHYDAKGLPQKTRSLIEDLHKKLSGDSFEAKLRRYVRLNLLEDKFNEAGEEEDQGALHAQKLAQQAIESPHLLSGELSWLVTGKAKNGYVFGFELGQQDEQLNLWQRILRAWTAAESERSDYFLGGYLGGVFNRDSAQWEDLIEFLANDGKAELPFLIWRSGMTAKAAELLLDHVKRGFSDPVVLRVLVYGAAIRKVPRALAIEFLRVLLSAGSHKHLVAALELYDSAFMDKKDAADDSLAIAYEILAHNAFFGGQSEDRLETMEDYHWNEVAQFLAKNAPEKALALARKSLEGMGAKGGVFGHFMPQSLEFLNYVLETNPTEMWAEIAAFIGPPIDTRAYYIMQWLRGDSGFRSNRGSGPLNSLPRDVLWKWIEEKLDPRAWYIAHYAPFALSPYGEPPKSLIREILERYGSSEEVRRAVHANCHTEGWSGPASLHHQQTREHFLRLRSLERDANVRRWLDEEIEDLSRMISKEQMEEERRGY